MRTNMTLFLALITMLAFVVGCNGTEQQDTGSGKDDQASKSPSTTPVAPAQAATVEGQVLETMNSGGYTYVLVDAGDGPAWYAGPQTQVAVGDAVKLPKNAMPMSNFESATLGRTFELVYFVGSIEKAGGTDAAAAVVRAAHSGAPAAAPDTDFTGIEKASGGVTVAEIFKTGAASAGQEITFRGKVVKFSANIMGKNWAHVRDGTGAAGTNDITVTTADRVKVGDTVLVTGTLVADKDFGHGYRYDLIVEEANLIVE